MSLPERILNAARWRNVSVVLREGVDLLAECAGGTLPPQPHMHTPASMMAIRGGARVELQPSSTSAKLAAARAVT